MLGGDTEAKMTPAVPTKTSGLLGLIESVRGWETVLPWLSQRGSSSAVWFPLQPQLHTGNERIDGHAL